MIGGLIFIAMLGCGLSAQQPEFLAPDTAVERTIQPGEAHQFRLRVAADQFVYVTAQQLGTDVAIALTGPGGVRFAKVDRMPYGSYEDLPWIATAAGECGIEISTTKRSQPSGSYRLEVKVRPPTQADRSLLAAFVAGWMEGPELEKKQTAAAFRDAIKKYELAEVEARNAGDASWEAFALSAQSLTHSNLGNQAKSRELQERALALQEKLNEPYSLSVTLNGLGWTNSGLGELDRAELYYLKALEIRRQWKDRIGEGVLLNNIAFNHKRQSEYDKAIDVLNQSLAIRKETGDRTGEAVTYNSLGEVYFNYGDLQLSLECYLESWKIRSTQSNLRGRGVSAINLGSAYYYLGNATQARELWKQAETIFREIGDSSNLGAVLYAMGVDMGHAKNYQVAIRCLEEALALHQKASRQSVATINDLTALSTFWLELNNLEKAETYAREASERSRAAGTKAGIASALQVSGKIELARKNYDAARPLLLQAVDGYRAIGSRENESSVLTALVELESAKGNLVGALQFAERAAALVETGRAQLNDPNRRATYRAARSERVDAMSDLLMKLHGEQPESGYGERAFTVTERWRSRSLAEMIRESRQDLRTELTASQRGKEDELLAGISRIQRQLFGANVAANKQASLKEKLVAGERDLQLFYDDLRSKGNRYSAAQQSESLDVAGIRKQLLDRDSVFVEYALGAAQSYAWAITSDRVFSAVLPGRKEIEARLGAYRKLLGERVSSLTASSAMARLDEEGRVLTQMLLTPLQGALQGKKRLIIAPDGGLVYLPFEALPFSGARVIERYAVSYTPSASTLWSLAERARQRRVPQRNLLAFADPVTEGGSAPALMAAYRERGFSFAPLPNSRTEVESIRLLFERQTTTVYAGEEARERALKGEDLEDYRYLHFAAHGYFDEEQPARSGIVLSRATDPENDGVLQSPEIMRLRLNADMVTLSTCQSGLGKMLNGEGVMGLARAFFYAGAQSLTVSLWNVNDAATAELMKQFYRNVKAGASRDEALRKAKLSVMQTAGTAWRHPHFWAPFIVIGDAIPEKETVR